MSSSRERHARESAAKTAAKMGGGINRETIRQARIVAAYAPELRAEVIAGKTSVNAAYRQVVGDERVPLYLKLDKDTDELIRLMADELGTSRQQVVLAMIGEWIGSRSRAS